MYSRLRLFLLFPGLRRWSPFSSSCGLSPFYRRSIQDFLMQSLKRVCALPVALFASAFLGTLWSDASWGEHLHAISPTNKLLALPILMYHQAVHARCVGFCCLFDFLHAFDGDVLGCRLRAPPARVEIRCGVRRSG